MTRARANPAAEAPEFESLRRELDGLRASESELRTTLQVLRRARTSEGVVTVAGTLVRWVCGVAMFYFCYLAVGELAGKTSLADIGIRFLGALDVSMVLSWAVSIGGLAYGLRQRALRRAERRRLQRRNAELEMLFVVEGRPG